MGSGKKITVGYKYYLGLHFGLCQGPVDALLRVIIGDRDAWTGEQTSTGAVSINKPDLFGGKKREGGVVGDLSVLMGTSGQSENSYLAAKIGAGLPAFRGILTTVWNGGHVTSNNPYLKPWAFRVRRIKQGWTGGSCWYPGKAEIVESAALPYYASGWEYQQVAHHSSPATTNLDIPSAGWTSCTGPFGSGVTGAPGELVDPSRVPNTPWEIKTILWARTTIPLNTSYSHILRVHVENGAVVFVNGAVAATINASNTQITSIQVADIVVSGASVSIAVKAYDEELPALGGTFLAVEVLRLENVAMNPAHIIYQCLTDTAWGMGYPTASIDDAAFTAAADALYAEGFGLSMVWNQQDSIENFVGLVLDHIGGLLYVVPDTAKFALKLIRDDYDIGDLDVYGPDNLISVEDYQRQAWGETVNEITVVYTDGAAGKETSTTVQDLANVQIQCAVVAQTRNYPGIVFPGLAQRVAMRDLIAVSTPLAKVRLTATRAAWRVFPGDVIRLNWPVLGIDDIVFRVLEVNRGTLTDGQIIIDAVEDIFSLPDATYLVDQGSTWVDPGSAPAAAPASALMEAPYWDLARNLSQSDLSYVDAADGHLVTVAARPSGDAFNYSIYAKVGSADYAEVGVGDFCPTATISGALTKTTTALTLTSGIDLEFVEVDTYAVIGGEYVLVTAIDAGAGTATISRGVLDTVPDTHAAGSRIWFADGNLGYDQTEYVDGEVLDVKILPATGQGTFDLALATPSSLTFDQRQYRPYAPGKLRVNTEVYPETIDGTAELALSWQHRDRLAQTAYIVEQDDASIGPEAGTTYRIRLYGEDDNLLRTVSSLTGTSYTYDSADEQSDAGLPVGESTPSPLDNDAGYPTTTAMLEFNGSNGSTTFTDWIGNAWSANGNAQLTTTSPIRGTASLLLDGTGDWINAVIPGAVGTVDFTIECEIIVTSLASDGEIFCISDSGGNLNNFNIVFEVKTTGALRGSIQIGSGGTVNVDISTATGLITTATRYHVAFVAEGTTARLYIEGVQRASGTITGTRVNNQSYCRIGYLQATYPRYFYGKIDNFRVRAGECLYPGGTTFTPPTSFTTWNRLSYLSSITTAETNNAQGVASDGTNLFFSSSGTLYKYTKAGVLVTSRSVSGDTPTGKDQINGLKYHDGRLFVCAADFSTVGTSWVVEYDPSTLTYIQHWTITGDWFIEGLDYHSGYFWAVFHANKVVAQLDATDFSVIATHDLSFYLSGSSGGFGSGQGYDGIAWYGEHIFCNVHTIYTEDFCDVYGWTGSEFVEVARLRWPTTKSHQGICLDPSESNILWFAERAPSGTDGIAKVEIVGEGSWALTNTRLSGKLSFELESVRDGAASWQPHAHVVLRTGYGYNYGYYYGGT